jgi:hypothetical protein
LSIKSFLEALVDNSVEIVENQVAIQYANLINGLHSRWQPHETQRNVIKAVFHDDYKRLFLQCGRKWGKTEAVAYILWRIAQSIPGSPCYFIAPFQKQAKEILWATKRLQTFGPREWLLDGDAGINNTEMRLRFKNDSFIKVDGSDNHESYRGIKYRICVYDEAKDHDPKFYEGMRPNAAAMDGIDIFVGTPPAVEGFFTERAGEHKSLKECYYAEYPSECNPHIPKKWLETEKNRLERLDEAEVWLREYMAKFVKGGKGHILPQIINYPITPHTEGYSA